jgi:hypothetical protein
MFSSPNFQLPQKTKDICNKLKNLVYIYIILLVFRFITGDFSVIFTDAFLLIMIFIFLTQIDSFMVAWCILLEVFALFNTTITLLFIFQNYLFGYIESLFSLYFILQLTQFIVYILLIHYSFLIYKEYKALRTDMITNDYRKLFNFRITIEYRT